MPEERPGDDFSENTCSGPSGPVPDDPGASGGASISPVCGSDSSAPPSTTGGLSIGDALRAAGASPSPVPAAKIVGPDPLKEAWAKLREKGITRDHVLTDGAAHHETQTEWQCKLCRAYNIALVNIDGVDRIIPDKAMKCWKCGGASWMSVEGGYHDPATLDMVGQPRRGVYSEPDRSMLRALNEADALLDEAQLFPSDSSHEDKEPHWPHDIAVSIVGAAIYLGRVPAIGKPNDGEASDVDADDDSDRVRAESLECTEQILQKQVDQKIAELHQKIAKLKDQEIAKLKDSDDTPEKQIRGGWAPVDGTPDPSDASDQEPGTDG